MLRVIAIVFTDECPGGDARVCGIALSLKTYLSDSHNNACVGLNTSVSPLCILTLALNILHCAIKISQDIYSLNLIIFNLKDRILWHANIACKNECITYTHI